MVQELKFDPRDDDKKPVEEEDFVELTEEHDWEDTDVMTGDDGPTFEEEGDEDGG